MKEQIKVFFNGTVQGVGFRYSACKIAAGYDVGGAVSNLPDGRVECVVEGEADQVRGFLDDLRDTMSGHIIDIQEHKGPFTGVFCGKFVFR